MQESLKDELVKEDILKEAQKLFQQYGLRKTTMEDIARSMGKGKSTLYYYYSSKEEIFDAVINYEMAEVLNQAKSAACKLVTASEKLKAFSLAKMKSLQQKANLYRIVRGEMQDEVRCMKHISTEYMQQEVKFVKSLLKLGIETGEFSSSFKKEMDTLPAVIVSSLRGLERDMFMGITQPAMEKRIASAVSIIVNGLKK